MFPDERDTAAFGDTVMLVTKDRKTYLRTLRPGGSLQSHYGMVHFDDLIGLPFGARLKTHLGQEMWLLLPSLDDLITNLHRRSQIIYPKDLGYILMKLNIRPGLRVIEAGTGSGALTLILATMLGDQGHLYSYDRRPEMQAAAHENLARAGLLPRVTFIERDIATGFDQRGVHALFLDVYNPWAYLDQASAALRGGGFLGSIVPTMNQVIELTSALYQGPWFFVEVEELLLRRYKTVPARMRPEDQMIGHTGYLVFARALTEAVPETESAPADAEDEA